MSDQVIRDPKSSGPLGSSNPLGGPGKSGSPAPGAPGAPGNSGTPGAATAAGSGGPAKLHIDSDWKAQAQQEKERLAKQEEQRAAEGDGGRGQGELPPADFKTLVDVLASQAMMGLGAMGDPKTGRVVVDLEGAKFNIDLLDVIEQKTKGNLSEEEAKDLRQVLAGLRSRFVYFVQLMAKQAAAGPAATPGLSGAADPRPVGPVQL